MPFIGKQPQAGAYSKLDAITTSATATYNLTLDSGAYYPQSANHLLVSLNGVIQAPQDSFTVSGSQITFDSALTSADVIDFIIALGDTLDIGVPSAGSVNTSQLANDAVTTAKIGANAVGTTEVADDAITGAKIENNPTIAGTLGVTGTGGVSGGTAAVAYGDADDLVVGNGSGNRGMSIYTGTSNAGSIYFSDASSGTGQYDGYISYNHNNRTMVAYSGINYGLNIDGVNKTVRLTDGGTQRLRIDNDGIKFGTDSAAVNALDDYEEGTWTPSFTGAGSNPTVSYTVQIGYYTKIGSIVYATCDMRWSGWTGGSGHLRINTLPFLNNGAGSGQYQNGVNINYFVGATATVRGGYLETNSTYYYARLLSDNNSLLQANQVSNSGGHFMGTVVYRTNA